MKEGFCGLLLELLLHVFPHLILLLFITPPAEFSRESLLEAGGGLKCPLSKDKMDCSNSTDVADPSLRQRATQAGRVHESEELPGEVFNPQRMLILLQASLDVVCYLFIYVKQLWPRNL